MLSGIICGSPGKSLDISFALGEDIKQENGHSLFPHCVSAKTVESSLWALCARYIYNCKNSNNPQPQY